MEQLQEQTFSTDDKFLSPEQTNIYIKIKKRMTEGILSKKEEFKERGLQFIQPELAESWQNLIDKSFSDLDAVWYNGATIEATIQCLEKLSNKKDVRDVYKLIDVQTNADNCIYLDMQLSSLQNYSVTSIVGTYHERGQEFCDYRNEFVDGQIAKNKYMLQKRLSEQYE